MGNGTIPPQRNRVSIIVIRSLSIIVITLTLRQRRVQHPSASWSMTEAVYDEMFNLNAKGPLFVMQKLMLLINRGGSIVLTTSIANVKGMPGNATYGAAKAALRSFARTLAAELLPREIRVNAVTPGPIDTPILGKAFTGRRGRPD